MSVPHTKRACALEDWCGELFWTLFLTVESDTQNSLLQETKIKRGDVSCGFTVPS